MSSRAEKSRRQREILELLRERPIASQEELGRALARKGHRVAQSTLSRDLRDLRVLRVATEHGYRYLAPERDAPALDPAGLRQVVAAEVSRVTANETLVVVGTPAGRASGVAAFLDGLQLEGVLATIAGDDTVLVVPVRVGRTAELEKRLNEVLGRA